MSENGGKRVASPSPSNGQTQGAGSMGGSVLSGRNRAASTSKSVMSVMSNRTVTSYQLTGSKKLNTAPRKSPGSASLLSSFWVLRLSFPRLFPLMIMVIAELTGRGLGIDDSLAADVVCDIPPHQERPRNEDPSNSWRLYYLCYCRG